MQDTALNSCTTQGPWIYHETQPSPTVASPVAIIKNTTASLLVELLSLLVERSSLLDYGKTFDFESRARSRDSLDPRALLATVACFLAHDLAALALDQACLSHATRSLGCLAQEDVALCQTG